VVYPDLVNVAAPIGRDFCGLNAFGVDTSENVLDVEQW
jgi:hypothetical protein